LNFLEVEFSVIAHGSTEVLFAFHACHTA
jgi:hypothetical protein